jgi:hypothetical protein
MRRLIGTFTVVGFSLIAISCSTAPQAPQPGTPAFYWAAAKSTYGAGDFLKATDNLTQIIKGESEFKARALPLSILLNSGIAKAYMEMADNLDTGARTNRANPTPFRRQATLLRGYASSAAMQSAESLHFFQSSVKGDTVAFEFGYPPGNAAEPVQLQRMAKGMLFPEAEIQDLQKAMVQRGVLLSIIRGVGAGADPAKALEIFKAGEVKVPRATYLLAVAKSLHEQAELFCPKKLDQPNRVKMLCNEAEEAVKSLPETKETKAVLSDIAKMRKMAKIT